jgi:hypothetical protein
LADTEKLPKAAELIDGAVAVRVRLLVAKSTFALQQPRSKRARRIRHVTRGHFDTDVENLAD